MPPLATDPKVLIDGFSTVKGGVDSGNLPILLGPDTLSFAVNCSVRGGFLKPRPGIKGIDLVYPNTVIEERQKNGRFQVAGYYDPDAGSEVLLASIGGRQFKFNVLEGNTVEEITITYTTTTTADFVPPAIGAQVVVPVADASLIFDDATILINGKNYHVIAIAGLNITVENIDDDGSTNPVPSGSAVVSYDVNPDSIDQAWEVQAEKWWILRDGQSIPFIYDGAVSRRALSQVAPSEGKEIGPGRMMVYAMGRIWGALTDQRSFRAGDLVGGTSGTAAEKFRDAVLKETENTFLNSGDFVTPISAGGIQGMIALAILDTSLGQGPILIVTPNYIFSVNSPLDRTVWAALENPIQTISQITNGGLSHYATVNVNGDVFYRSKDGIRSYMLTRRDFHTWSNSPVSFEMNRIIDLDEDFLLRFSNAVVFNRRMLMTISPFYTQHGCYHRGWISLDYDLIGSIGKKSPPVYDGIGIGANVLQLVTGEFAGVQRTFAFTLNFEQEIELYELTKNDKFDRQTDSQEDIQIRWIFETQSFRFGTALYPERKVLKKLNNLELEISNLIGEVVFKVYFKPDSHPCWIFWKEFTECATYKDCGIDPLTGCQNTTNYKPQFRPRLSLGEPPNACDPITNRPYRHGYSFQVRVEIAGYCEIKSMNLFAEERLETYFGTPVGC